SDVEKEGAGCVKEWLRPPKVQKLLLMARIVCKLRRNDLGAGTPLARFRLTCTATSSSCILASRELWWRWSLAQCDPLMPRLITTLAVMVTLGTISYAQTCSCAGSLAYKSGDGDGAPLIWSFQAFRKSPGSATEPQIICYVRHVENQSANEVRD